MDGTEDRLWLNYSNNGFFFLFKPDGSSRITWCALKASVSQLSYFTAPTMSLSSSLHHLFTGLVERKRHTANSAGQMWAKTHPIVLKDTNRTWKCAFSNFHCLLWRMDATGGLTGGWQSHHSPVLPVLTGVSCRAVCAGQAALLGG